MKTQTQIDIKQEYKTSENENEFFNKLIHSIQVDKDCYGQKILNPIAQEKYNRLIEENETNLIEILDKHSQKKDESDFAKLIWNFIVLLSKNKVKLIKLGFDKSDSNILIWAILPDEDEKNENKFIASVSKANAENESKFYLDAVWFEKEDNLKLPSNFIEIF
ncbi:MAG: hypothetical protein IAE65_00745 [Ignavibacteria bacterium]|nr:hypothetical protein [Ignavibacteria bacterium]